MAKNSSENKIQNLMESAMKDLNSLVDVNTIMGKPIVDDNGTVIIPVSKVTMGFMTGGGEYGDVKVVKGDEKTPFAGGSGAVISMKPAGFLVDNGEGVKIVNVSNDIYDKIFDSAEEFIKRGGIVPAPLHSLKN